MKKKLTPKRINMLELVHKGETQADAYLNSFNTNCTRKTAARKAQEILAIPECAAYLNDLREKSTDDHRTTITKIVKKLECVIDYDVRKLFNQDGSLKAIHEIDNDTAAAISGIKLSRLRKILNHGQVEEVLDIRALDALRATEQLGRHLKMFDENAAPKGRAFVLNIYI